MKHLFLILMVFSVTGCASLPYYTTQETRNKYVSEHPDLSKETRDNILSQRFSKGMTKEQIVAALGKPGEIMTLQDPSGTVEMWTYYAHTKLYFRGDLLSYWYSLK